MEPNADALGTVAQVINYQLSIINYQLSIVNCQLSIIDKRFSYLPRGLPCPQKQAMCP